MDLEVDVNPAAVTDEYLDGLNTSFGHWGDLATYRWDFEREVGAPPADLMVVRDEGRIIAGSAVSYRTVSEAGREMLIGIMTGSWTRPEARGRGAFSRVIEASAGLVAQRQGSALIAFVTHDNASRRRLVAAGFAEVPTWYLPSVEATASPARASGVEPLGASPAELYRAFRAWQEAGPGATIVYPTLATWTATYLERPLPVEVLRAGGCPCIVERAPVSDRLLWTGGDDPRAALAPLLARAVAARRQLFVFTVDPAVATTCEALGMEARPGSITVRAVEVGNGGGGRSPAPLSWRIQAGDRA